jgi:heme-degrading monooxygenase HmoA
MFVHVSKFTVANAMTEEVKEAFRNRSHLVDRASGFVRMDVISPQDALDEIWVITYWADEGSFNDWRHSDAFRQSHKRIPKGLKLKPGGSLLQAFEHVAS